MAIAVWTVSALGWSAFANLVIGDAAYVPRTVLLTLGLVVMAWRLGLRPRALGVSGDNARSGLVTGIASFALVALVLLVAVALADHIGFVRTLLGDRRADLATGSLVFAALVRIPLGTVLFEEFLFRGLGLALLLEKLRPIPAVLVNSAVFGLWHVAPTIVALRLNDVEPASIAGIGGIVGAVVVTSAAGLVFAWLRLRTGSLLAPVLTHWSTNALGLLAAASQ